MNIENIYGQEIEHISKCINSEKLPGLNDPIIRSTLIDYVERYKKCEKNHYCCSCNNQTLVKVNLKPFFFCIDCFWFGHIENVNIVYPNDFEPTDSLSLWSMEEDTKDIQKKSSVDNSFDYIIQKVENYIENNNLACFVSINDLVFKSINVQPQADNYFPKYFSSFTFYEKENYSYFSISSQKSRGSYPKKITSNVLFFKKSDEPLYFAGKKSTISDEDIKKYKKPLFGNEENIINDFCKFIDFALNQENTIVYK